MLINKIKMEALRSIPRVLEGIEDIHHNGSASQVLAEYKRNVREFIKSITQEVEAIINQYEKKIHELKEENQRLKQANPNPNPSHLPLETAVKKFVGESPSPKFTHSGGKRGSLELMPTAKSNVFKGAGERF